MRKRIFSIFAILMIASLVFSACSQSGSSGNDTEQSEDAGQQHDFDAQEHEIGAFEITAAQRELAKENEAGYPVLDASLGNPNWINTKARYAFIRFMEYALGECERTFDKSGMAGHAKLDGIGDRFDMAMDSRDETDAFIIEAIDYCVEELGLDKDELIKELADGIIGDYYPSSNQSLKNTQVILNKYLESTLYDGEKLAGKTKVFPTEGEFAALKYIFNSLAYNSILNPGDNIAIATPIFTPHLQIPNVEDYTLVSVDLTANKEYGFDISDEELLKLKDPSVKVFFLVNPSNLTSYALSKDTLKKLKDVVAANPDLVIITDDVYGTFVNDFKTVYSVVPYNTILIYSFSKLYGVTGWSMGLVAMHEDKEFLQTHTGVLSTPMQVFMDFLALTHLVCEDEDPYIEITKEVVSERYDALMDALGLEPNESVSNTGYYALIDMVDVIKEKYGDNYAEWYKKNVTDLDFLNDLAQKKGVVLMYVPGFEGSSDSVRVSLADLEKDDYTEIVRRIFELLDEYFEESGR